MVPMKRGIRIALVAVVLVVAVAGAAFAGAIWLGERKMSRQVFIKVVPVPFASGAAALRQGRYLFETRGCGECHGPDGAGRVMIDDEGGLFVRTPNITRGPNGVVADYAEADWVRTIRHGINPAGHALLVMPSEDFNRLTDEDLAALVAFARSLPPIAGEPAEIRMPVFVKALYGIGAIKDAAEKINHNLPPPSPVPVGATVAHGSYVARMCIGCHGDGFSGGRIPGSPPDWAPAANLTPGDRSAMARYDTPEKFAAMMRTGKRPDGSTVSSVMPFDALKGLNDTDLAAIYAFLNTLPARPFGSR